MQPSDKVMPRDQMHCLKTLIFTHLQFIKAVASDQHNYANNIKMIKGVHQLTFRPSTPDMGRITLKSNALNYHYLSKMCIELALPLLDFEKVMH